MEQYQQGNGIQKSIRVTEPDEKANGDAFNPNQDLSHYDAYWELNGITAGPFAWTVTGNSFTEFVEIDDQEAGIWTYWFVTIGVNGETSAPSEKLSFEILPFIHDLLPPTDLS